ncbi:hypothetical protein DFH05DRAFT_944578 [Lentinula detonsa]|uniref:Uncharacterized protein n=1 Tax=Lentinula detonsa TaxID=2804962 RepID=A0A9W8P4A1_9AGAR|nr:hypothetical protein DFH05DRAFT_944578 [Lentinula detonsa]
MLPIPFLSVIATIIDVVILGYCPFESLRSRLVGILLRPAGCFKRWVSTLEIVPRIKHFVCCAWGRLVSFCVTLRR